MTLVRYQSDIVRYLFTIVTKPRPFGLVTPYGETELGQHWLKYWFVARRHQAITWTNVDLPSKRSSDNHQKAILQEIPQPSIKISLKISYHSNPPVSNELTAHLRRAFTSKQWYIIFHIGVRCKGIMMWDRLWSYPGTPLRPGNSGHRFIWQ